MQDLDSAAVPGDSAPGLAPNLVEIFWSVQGEGTQVGLPSVFVRFGECDLRCAWCDSPGTWQRAERCRIERDPGAGTFETRENPVPVEDAAEAVLRLHAASGRQARLPAGPLVSLTGGEPLLQADAVAELVASLRARSQAPCRFLLETHGLARDALARIVSEIDVVSMDWKLASDVRRAADPRHGSVADFHDAHDAFLACARKGLRAGGSVYVKVVVTPASRDDEIDEACRRIALQAPGTTLVLQPVTPFASVREDPSAARLLALLKRCRDQLTDVRVIPQTHKSLGVL